MENRHQVALRRWIHAGLAIREVRNLQGDAGYILNNMIAKYSLYADRYSISLSALRALKQQGVNTRDPVLRGSIYGKDQETVFEHAVPATVVREQLLASSRSRQAVGRILRAAGPVAILTRTEDTKLNRLGLSQSMPRSWTWGGDVLARYKEAGIRLSRRSIVMTGAVKR